MNPTLAWYSSTICLALYFQCFIAFLLLPQITCYFSRTLKATENCKGFFVLLFCCLFFFKMFLNLSD